MSARAARRWAWPTLGRALRAQAGLQRRAGAGTCWRASSARATSAPSSPCDAEVDAGAGRAPPTRAAPRRARRR
ncbi:MAG: hypothetical protein MZW92_14025 [Comamonadaceae bacterium]|nr:hypothetical protein [Comamonadaceae bacterium]